MSISIRVNQLQQTTRSSISSARYPNSRLKHFEMFHNPVILSRSSSSPDKDRYQNTFFWIKLTFRVIWAVKIGIPKFNVACTYSSVAFKQRHIPTENWVATTSTYANESRLLPARNHRHQQEEHPWKLSIKTITNLTRLMYLNSKPLLWLLSHILRLTQATNSNFCIKPVTSQSEYASLKDAELMKYTLEVLEKQPNHYIYLSDVQSPLQRFILVW